MLELGSLAGVFFLPNGQLVVTGLLMWGVAFAAAEWFFVRRIPLVAVSRTWERIKDVLSWAIVAFLIAFVVAVGIVFR